MSSFKYSIFSVAELVQACNPGLPSAEQGSSLYPTGVFVVFSCFRLLGTPWTVAPGIPLCMGFLSQEYWNGLPSPPPGDLPDSGIEPMSAALKADSLLSQPPGKPTSPLIN